MDDNFVKFATTNEPSYGTKPEQYSAIGVVRLTQDGTQRYDSYSDKTVFLNNLKQELVNSIPIDSERLQLTNRVQYDPSVSSQYLLQIEILPTQDPYQDSVSRIVETIKELIKDEINLWDELKLKLLGLLIGCIILLAIALWARFKNSEGQSFTIFQITFIFVNLILDILFIVKNGKDVPWLYFPRFAGFEIFNAPFSDFTKCWIYWGTIINIFIKNIPQLVIQQQLRAFTSSYVRCYYCS
ncbi:hypothetical protein C2G38_2029844 [Gigaspora rosea]|uniref:Uncharacterized protein n=1 Tax=Gigaspora rosea TaxID=44941 RepID=A0A397VYI0_9GLOM|nr:hypothetical protein C2G38_2029844 [Gigaspora rosea]